MKFMVQPYYEVLPAMDVLIIFGELLPKVKLASVAYYCITGFASLHVAAFESDASDLVFWGLVPAQLAF